MAHLSKFGLENFRVFRDETVFDLAPLTILTGPNSSGKSTVYRALQLLKNNLNRTPNPNESILNIEISNHNYVKWIDTNILNFDECLSKGSNNDSITFIFGATFPVISEEVFLKLKYSKPNIVKEYYHGAISKISNGTLAELSIYSLTDTVNPIYSINFTNQSYREVKVNLSFFKNKFNEKISDALKSNESQSRFLDECSFLSKIRESKDGKRVIQYDPNTPILPLMPLFLQLFEAPNIAVSSPFYRLADGKMYEFFSTYRDNIKINGKTEDEIIIELQRIENDLFKNPLYINKNFHGSVFESDITFFINYFDLKSYDIFPFGDKQLEDMVEKGLGNYLEVFKKNKLKWQGCKNAEIFEEFLNVGINQLLSSLDLIKDMDYVEALRAKQQRSYSFQKESNSFNQSIYNLIDFDFTINNETHNFLKFSENLFEIENFGIDPNASKSGFEVYVNEMLLCNVGYGITQVLTIVLKIIEQALNNVTYIDNNNYVFKPSFLYVEEPETNLHPNFQSKLADLFVKANKEFNIQFVVETHSEYLIRKLQILTANNEIKPEDTVIYYFHNPNKIPESEKQVKKILIEKGGNLSDDFGEGFFDEADNLAIKLFSLNKNQKN